MKRDLRKIVVTALFLCALLTACSSGEAAETETTGAETTAVETTMEEIETEESETEELETEEAEIETDEYIWNDISFSVPVEWGDMEVSDDIGIFTMDSVSFMVVSGEIVDDSVDENEVNVVDLYFDSMREALEEDGLSILSYEVDHDLSVPICFMSGETVIDDQLFEVDLCTILYNQCAYTFSKYILPSSSYTYDDEFSDVIVSVFTE